MIRIEFSQAVALYIFCFLLAALAMWVFSRQRKNKEMLLDHRFIWFCSVCTYTYVNTKEDSISVCPRCGSYNKKEGRPQ